VQNILKLQKISLLSKCIKRISRNVLRCKQKSLRVKEASVILLNVGAVQDRSNSVSEGSHAHFEFRL
jgi:hypothetical protein